MGYVIENVYPGKQSIGRETARLILERNVGKIIVVESAAADDEAKKRSKAVKFYLRFDAKLNGDAITNPMGRVLQPDAARLEKSVVCKIQCPTLVVFGDRGYP